MINLLRRAWDALDTFKQAYPENWHDEDEQVLKDLIRADLNLSGVKLKWVDLTDEDVAEVERWVEFKEEGSGRIPTGKLVTYINNKLKEKNT
jgi:hypothetical protein